MSLVGISPKKAKKVGEQESGQWTHICSKAGGQRQERPEESLCGQMTGRDSSDPSVVGQRGWRSEIARCIENAPFGD